jgi:hypothetical protein
VGVWFFYSEIERNDSFLAFENGMTLFCIWPRTKSFCFSVRFKSAIRMERLRPMFGSRVQIEERTISLVTSKQHFTKE